MKITITPFVIEASVEHYWQILSKKYGGAKSKNRLEVLNAKEFFGDWIEYFAMISNKAIKPGSTTLPKGIQFYELMGQKADYKSFDQFAEEHKDAKNVIVLKLNKNVVSNASKCVDVLSDILYGAFGVTEPFNYFLLGSEKYYYAGMFLEY